MRLPRTLVLPLLALIVLAAAAGACGRVFPNATDNEFAELSEVVSQLRANFIHQEKLAQDELNRAAIRGIIEYLDDPYTSYLLPRQYQEWTGSLSGQENRFEGIGAQVTVRNGDIMILGPLPGSPASRAGIRPGDVVLEVDGQSVRGMELLEAVSLIRGPKGTEVKLLISRLGEVRPIEIAVVRDEIQTSSVSSRVHAEGIGVIHLDTFDARTVQNLRDAIERLRADGAQGLVLDLRYNSGGLVEAAVGVVSQFVESGNALIVEDADGAREAQAVTGDGIAYDVPLVVITNSFTASAAEIVTGALHDHDRATVVGTKTFGKGSVNILSQLSSGAGLYVTAAHWLTPDGRLIEGVGLSPDIEVGAGVDIQRAQRIGILAQSLCEAFEADRDALEGQQQAVVALDNLCNLEPEPPPIGGEDEQLNAAVETLRGLIGASR